MLDSINDVDNSYDTFVHIFESTYNKCLPTKVVKIKAQSNSYKPWITSGIKKSIKHKDKLFKSWLLLRTDDSKAKYRSYHNHRQKLSQFNYLGL